MKELQSGAVQKMGDEVEYIEIILQEHNVSLDELFKHTEKYMGKKYLVYDAITNNCQVFISSILKANGISNKEITDFIMQDIPSVLDEVGHGYGKFARLATDLASKFDILLHGAGRNRVKF
jgi:hypothetical protein